MDTSSKMEGARWERAREVFLDLSELAPAARAARLARLRDDEPEFAAWVERLLAADIDSEPELPPSTPAVPRRFGAYEETRLLAAGGMGEVYTARRIDGEFEREVAVKLVKRGFDSPELVARFQRERQTLARLDHEFVARLLDGGTTADGEPYIVMEFVDGVPLDAFCDGLEIPERLRVFLRVCAAVRHAHEHGVIHRDLKPNNILVRVDGTPRLLDFGIAHTPQSADTPAGPLTKTGHRLFTPEYASPEQVRGELVDETTDVFALGVLLYRVLSEAGPWSSDVSLHELEREVCELDPIPPSRCRTGSARRGIAGDLDTITLRCLEKEPTRRYASVAALVEDIDRHLAGFPIRARRTTLLGRAWRYGRRKPWKLVGVSALVVAALAAERAWDTGRASSRRRTELATAIEARVETARLLREQSNLDAADEELRAALRALEELPGESLLFATVLGQLAVLANHRGRFEECLAHVEEARALLSEDGSDPKELRLRGSLLGSRAHALSRLGTPGQSRQAALDFLEYVRSALPPGHELRVDALLGMTDQHRAAGEHQQALGYIEEAVAEARASEDPHGAGLGSTLNLWGLTLADLGRWEEALPRYEQSLEALGWQYGEGHSWIAQVRENLGESLFRLRRLDEAAAQHARALNTRERLDLPVAVAASQWHLGKVAHEAGEHGVAEEHLERCLVLRREHLAQDHPRIGHTLALLGLVRAARGDAPGAQELFERALGQRFAGRMNPNWELRARTERGRYLCGIGEVAAGRAELQRALDLSESSFGRDDPRTLEVHALLEGVR